MINASAPLTQPEASPIIARRILAVPIPHQPEEPCADRSGEEGRAEHERRDEQQQPAVLLGHGFGPELTTLRVRQHTGWLEAEDGEVRYAPHTEQHYRTPRGTTATAFVNGGQAKLNKRRAGRAEAREKR